MATTDFQPIGLDWGTYFLNQEPRAAYQAALGRRGAEYAAGLTPRAQFYSDQYNRLYNTYLSQLPQRGANYGWTDFLGDQGTFGDLDRLWRGLPYSQRGLNVRSSVAPLRWIR